MALLDTTSLYITLQWLYFTLLYSVLLYHGCTSFYFTLQHTIMVLLHSTLLYITLPLLYVTLLYSMFLYHGSIWLYFTLR